VRLVGSDGDDLGLARLPCPVQPGDLVALEHGSPLQIVALVALEPGGSVDLLAEVEPARIVLAG
jgi:hypothetical protein